MPDWNVMIVDDEADFANTLAERLTLRGIHVRTAHDGEAAIQMVNEEPPQVMLLDVSMPGISGFDVLKIIKSQRPEIQVIMLTGHGSTRGGMDGMREGAFDYLTKPVNLEDLLSKLEEAIATG